MSPRIILHIGQQKTGTTALQLGLVADRGRLLDAGVLYPDVGHLRARRSDALRPSHNGLFYAIEGQETDRLVHTAQQIQSELHRQIAESGAHTVVMSAERAFQAMDHHTDVLERLDEVVPGEKRVVAYLRRPDKYVVSFHKHDIRMGARVAGLHTRQRLERLSRTSRLDHTRALGLYEARYRDIRIFRYEEVGDTLGHFYREVLGMEPPPRPARRANVSIPAVFTNLMRQHVGKHGRLARRQIRAIVAYGEQEPVDLLGPENRRLLVERYRPHNAYLGRLAGRTVLFDELDDVLRPDPAALSVAEADARYGAVFAALLAAEDVGALRDHCRRFEQRGDHATAERIYSAVSRRLDRGDRDWFRRDLERSSDGAWTVAKTRYVAVGTSGAP